MVKHPANSKRFTISNPVLLLLITILGIGILLDGILYNKAIVKPAIYPIHDAQSIELRHKDQLLLAFVKNKNKWIQVYPVKAPAISDRVQMLLDTNRFSSRRYKTSQLSGEDIFTDSVTLTINNEQYQLGSIEPVSGLRYVRANEHVYLQPDSVLPLLSAANNTFTDLKISNDVQQVSIANTEFKQPVRWSNLHAIDFVKSASGTGIEISLKQNNNTLRLTAHQSENGYVLSHPNGFHYLLDKATAANIGLTDSF